MNRTHLISGGRYPVLRALAILYLAMSAIVLLGGFIAAGYILATQPWQLATRVVWAIVSLAGTFFAVLGCFAIAEVIKLFIDIEHNSRQAATKTEFSNSAATVATAPAPSVQIPITSASDGGATGTGHRNRLAMLDEETAEAALIRGH